MVTNPLSYGIIFNNKCSVEMWAVCAFRTSFDINNNIIVTFSLNCNAQMWIIIKILV